MKYNVLTGLMALSLCFGTLTSCDKDEERAIVTATTASTLTPSASDVVLDADKLSETALTLSWSKADLGYDKALANYELLISPVSSPTTVETIDLGTVLTRAFTGKELNELLLDKLSATAGVKAEYTLTLRAYPYTKSSNKPSGTSVAVSSPITVAITAVNALVKSPDLFFVGNMFDAANYAWKNAYTGYPLFLDQPDGKEYTYTGHFNNASEFKFIYEANLGSWDTLYGKGSAGVLTLAGGDTNIKDITTAGYYTLTANPTAMTYSITAYDASSATTYTSIGLIGTAVGGWDADKVTFTKASYDSHIWTATGVVIAEGEMKFRANGAWNKSWGGTYFPVAKSDTGDNIKISSKLAGTYNVVFNDLTGHYHFRLQ